MAAASGVHPDADAHLRAFAVVCGALDLDAAGGQVLPPGAIKRTAGHIPAVPEGMDAVSGVLKCQLDHVMIHAAAQVVVQGDISAGGDRHPAAVVRRAREGRDPGAAGGDGTALVDIK